MPRVLEVDGFRVYVRLPPREHGPPHVHVERAEGRVTIELPSPAGSPVLRLVAGMSSRDIVRAFRIVEANADLLMREWRKYHG